MRELIKKAVKKFTARKFLAMLSGVAVGLCLIFDVDADSLSRIAGAVTSLVSLTSYILTEGRLDLAAMDKDEGEKDGDTGYLPDYNLRYYRTWQHGDEFIIFADVSSEEATMRSLLRLSVIIGLASLGGFFLISLLLARWAVKPVDKAWTQQRQFVSDASHELKTPLTVILTNAELLQDPDYSPEDRSRFSENILTMAHQMRGLVEGLLDLARVDNGAVRQAFREIDLSALVQEAVLPFEPVFYEKDLTLETSVEEGIKCKGSQRHLRQTVEILLDNAQKYADPGAVTLKLNRVVLAGIASKAENGRKIMLDEFMNDLH